MPPGDPASRQAMNAVESAHLASPPVAEFRALEESAHQGSRCLRQLGSQVVVLLRHVSLVLAVRAPLGHARASVSPSSNARVAFVFSLCEKQRSLSSKLSLEVALARALIEGNRTEPELRIPNSPPTKCSLGCRAPR